MIAIDGSQGEGGGQILRSALALSIATATPVELTRIRAGRKKPGLLRQHLTCVQAATAVSGARTEGAELGSSRVRFAPGEPRPGDYEFIVSTAGSACLVLQSILPALLRASGSFEIRLGGGTHNPFAPPFDFIARAFLPRLEEMGAKVSATLERRGFYPAGGGRLTVRVEPGEVSRPLDLVERGETVRRRATAIVAHLDHGIGKREIRVVRRRLGFEPEECEVVVDTDSIGPGNALVIEVESEHVTEVMTGFGEPRISAEGVGEHASTQVRDYLAANAPVGRYLADQLLLPMVLGAGGRFRTARLTKHASTNVEIIGMFLPGRIATTALEDGTVMVEVAA